MKQHVRFSCKLPISHGLWTLPFTLLSLHFPSQAQITSIFSFLSLRVSIYAEIMYQRHQVRPNNAAAACFMKMITYDLFPNIFGTSFSVNPNSRVCCLNTGYSHLIWERVIANFPLPFSQCVSLCFVCQGWVTHPLWYLSNSWRTVWSQYSNTRWSFRFLRKTSMRLMRLGCLSCWKQEKEDAKYESGKTVSSSFDPVGSKLFVL